MTDGPESLTALRAAAARVEALGHAGPPVDSAVDGEASDRAARAPAFDPATHAEAFEAVHDALVVVLADVERAADPTGQHPSDRT